MTKKRIIGIIAAVLVAAAVIGAAIFITTFDLLPEEKDPSTDLNIKYARESLVIYSCVLDDLKDIHVTNPTGEFTISRDEKGDLNFLGREGAPLLPYSSEGLYTSVAKVTCEALIEAETEHLEYYGLDDPQVHVYIEKKDGDVFLAQTYFSERFLRNHVQYYQKKISKEFLYTGFQSLLIDYPENSEKDDIYVRQTTDDEAKDIRFAGGMVLEEPFLWGGDSTPIQGIVEILSSLEAEDIITDTLDESLQQQYGFGNPTKVVIEAWVDPDGMYDCIQTVISDYDEVWATKGFQAKAIAQVEAVRNETYKELMQ